MKALYVVLLCSMATSFLATSVASIKCYVCYSTSESDYSCNDFDLGEQRDGCASCATAKLAENRFSRKCYPEFQPEGCRIKYGQQLCVCNTDLCNGNVTFTPILKCYECESKSTADLHCTATNLGEIKESCAACATMKLGDNRFTRECMPLYAEDMCILRESETQTCICNTDLCNGKDIFKHLIKCHECHSSSAADTRCTDLDFGPVNDKCLSCGAVQLDEYRFGRQCMSVYVNGTCKMKKGLQYCICNEDLCNADDIFRNVLECYDCSPDMDDDEGSCTDAESWKKKGECLACYTIKMNDKDFQRGCSPTIMPEGCSMVNGVNMCVCDTELCNLEDIHLPTMRCYSCKPYSANDTRCNFLNAGRVPGKCLSCSLSVDAIGRTTRACLDYAVAPSNKTVDGQTLRFCNTDRCNGEGELRIDTKSMSCGQQKTVSGRVLIGGAVAAMLVLAQLF